MSRTIVVTSGKGGVGKSSMTINLGYALASQGQKVCLIDADFGLKNLDVMMGLENRVIYDLNDVISNKCSLKQILVKDKRMDSLYLLPACKSLSFENLNVDYMMKMIEQLKNEFDFILKHLKLCCKTRFANQVIFFANDVLYRYRCFVYNEFNK